MGNKRFFVLYYKSKFPCFEKRFFVRPTTFSLGVVIV